VNEKTEGRFRLKGRMWQWRTHANADHKNFRHRMFKTVVKSGPFTYAWFHSDNKLDPKECLKLQFALLGDDSED
jgi:hypothetical protein